MQTQTNHNFQTSKTSSKACTVALRPLRDETDYALVQRIQNGDEAAFSEIVRRHYDRVLRVAVGMLKNRHEAEDVVQEAFVKVYRRIGDFNGTSAFYTWLYRIVVNLSIDSMRKKNRERRVDIEDEAAREAMASCERLWPGLDDSDPHSRVERVELAQRLRQAFSRLPDIHRDVIVLREVQGHSYEEIAEALGIKKGTVMSRLFHARKAMQDVISFQERRERAQVERFLAVA